MTVTLRISLVLLLLVPLASGCGSDANTTAGTPDEMTRFLAEHPELADPNPHEAASSQMSTVE